MTTDRESQGLRNGPKMQAIRATYHNGVFTPEEPVQLPDGYPVVIWLDQSGGEVSQLRPEDREFLDRLVVRRAEVFRRLAE
jgi:predicted DNA-binding antitoxin AbrB/MazE fold protein